MADVTRVASMVDFEGVTHRFGAQPAQLVLDDVTIKVPSGQVTAIVGPSGCGKTTLLNLAAGLVAPSGGRVRVQQELPRAGNPNVGYMLARDCLLPWRTALGNAALALEVQGVDRRERKRQARLVLDRLALGGYESYFPAQLSQGMRQRVALGRCFVAEPSILLLDEPFSALDAETKLDIHGAFLSMFEGSNATAVLVTHDVAEAVSLADSIVVLTRRPAKVRAVVPVDLPRPRVLADLLTDAHYHRVFDAVWVELRGEVRPPTSWTKQP